MTVETIPNIVEMTATQQIELMEALWKNMSERNVNGEPPDWHLEYLKDRKNAVAQEADSFISLDEFEQDLRRESKSISGYFVLHDAQLRTESGFTSGKKQV